MNISTRWIMALAIIVLPALVHGQTTSLTLEEAIELFKKNSLQRELARLEEIRKKGEAIQYKAYPNPEISVFREQLNAGTLDYHETTYQVLQPVEILGQPFLRNRSASKSQKAATLQFAYDEQALIRRVKSLYAEHWYLKHKLEIYDRAVSVIQKARNSAQARQAEGTFSGIQVQRFNIELGRYRKEQDSIQLLLGQTGNELRSMIFPDRKEFSIQDSLSVTVIPNSESELVQQALTNRADLQAFGELADASNLQLKVEKRERLPDLNVTFGYKNQSDGSEGFVIGGSIKMPIFNQNSGNVTTARAEARSRQTSLLLKKQMIHSQIETAYRNVQQIEDRWQAQQEHPVTAAMLETAQVAYREGQYSLVELLDATEAYVDGRSLTYETIADYNQALFELDLVSGGSLFLTQ